MTHLKIRLLPRGLRALVLVALAALVTAVPTARGQGTDEMLADPISTRELTKYADRLDLSPDQRLAFEALHDQYKIAFRALREGEIAELIERSRELEGSGIPSRKTLDAVFTDMGKLAKKIEKLDDGLFDRIIPMLSPEQSIHIDRVRMARARQRFTSNRLSMEFGGGSAPDLSETFFRLDLDLDPETYAAADSILASYESRLTAAMRKMFGSTTTIFLQMFDELEAEFGSFDNLNEEALMEDPELMEKFQTKAMEVMMRVTGETRKIGGDLRRQNHATYRQLASFLPEDDSRELRQAYIQSAYPYVGHLLMSPTERVIDRALDRSEEEDLDVDAIAALEEAKRRLREDRWTIIEQLVRKYDAQQETMSMFETTPEQEELQIEIAGLSERIQKIEVEVGQVLQEVLGVEMHARLLTGNDEGVVEAPGPFEFSDDNWWTGDQHVPPYLRRSELRRLTTSLAIDTDQRMLADDLHSQYVEAYRNADAMEKLQTAARERWQADPKTGMQSVGKGAVERVAMARKEALAEADAQDVRLFENLSLALTLDDDQRRILDLFATMRERRRLGSAGTAHLWMVNGDLSEGSLDLVSVVLDAGLDRDEVIAVIGSLEQYGEQTIAACREMHETQLRLTVEQEKWQARSMMQAQGGRNVAMDWQEFNESIEPFNKRVVDASGRLVEVNRSTLEQIAQALPTRTAQTLRRQYNQRAYPNVFTDPIAMHDVMESSLALDGLTAEQRDGLLDAAATYRPDYERLSREMIAVEKQRPRGTFGAEMDWQAYQEVERRLSQLRYDRDELCYRTANRIRALLDPALLESIGGLPAMEAENHVWW